MVEGDGAGEVIYMGEVDLTGQPIQRSMSERGASNIDSQANPKGGSARFDSSPYAVVKPKKAKKAQSLTDVGESGKASVGIVHTGFKPDAIVRGISDFAEPVEPAALDPGQELGERHMRARSYSDAVSDTSVPVLDTLSEDEDGLSI